MAAITKYGIEDLLDAETVDVLVLASNFEILGERSAMLGGANAYGTPAAPTVAPQGVVGSTTYTYYVVAVTRDGKRSLPSAAGTTSTGNATLTSGNFNRLTWAAVPGAYAYDILKTNTATRLATVTKAGANVPPATTYDDIGGGTSAYTVATRNETADLQVGGLVLDTGGYIRFPDLAADMPAPGAGLTVVYSKGGILWQRSGAAGVAVPVGVDQYANLVFTRQNTSTDYTVAATVSVVFIQGATGRTITLPDPTVEDRPITVYASNSAVVNNTVVASGGSTVFGGSTDLTTGAVINGRVTTGDSFQYYSDGTNWRV